jgi:TPR repeat protein
MRIASHMTAVAALTFSAWLPVARGETLDEALSRAGKLEEEARFADVVRVLEPFAANADGELAFRLAQAHLFAVVNGVDVKDAAGLDTKEARDWLDRAIELGNPMAYQLLYMVYQRGFGVPVDIDKAVQYLRHGVERNDPGAKLNLAVLAYEGIPPVEQDTNLAAQYFVELARGERPNMVAVYYLGVIMFKGEAGMPRDEKGGLEMIETAATQGVIDAERDMGKANEYGWAGREPELPASLQWYEKAASKGDGFSLWRIGLVYARGEYGSVDSQRAVEHFRQAAENGSRNGMTSLGVMYATGAGVGQDFGEARRWYERAAENGDAQAMNNLAVMYARGEGVEVDLVRAYGLAIRAHHAGNNEAATLIGLIEPNMTAVQLEDARQQSAAAKPRAP